MASFVHSDDNSDADSCAREPIHTLGYTQAHGVLIAVSEPDFIVRYVSANLTDLFALGPADVLEHPLANVLGAEQCETLRASLDPGDALAVTNVPLRLDHAAQDLECSAHRQDGMLLLEIEPRLGAHSLAPVNIATHLQRPIARMERESDIERLAYVAASEFRRASGCERVMIYRFDSDWNGEVIAEVGGASTAYLGHQFPASDIPAQARRLFLINTLRSIVDVESTPVPVLPAIESSRERPLDLSRSLLRSASPTHIEYLRNMGVRATLTISIIVRGQLWGMVTAHHTAPHRLDFSTRSVCDLLGQIFAAQIMARSDNAVLQERLRSREVIETYMTSIEQSAMPWHGEKFETAQLLDLLRADGLIANFDGAPFVRGITAEQTQLLPAIAMLSKHSTRGIASTNALGALMPSAVPYAQEASGALYLGLNERGTDYIVLFRREIVRTIVWAGDPRTSKSPNVVTGRIHPRASFASWQETVRGQSLPWTELDLENAQLLRERFISARLEHNLRARHEALNESERQYQYLAEALPHIVWTASASGAIDYVNGRWFDYTGTTFEDTKGRVWERVLHRDDVENCVELWMHSVAHGTPFEIEYRFQRASDGAYRWHLGRALPVRDATGSIMKWFGTCTDIDDQKRASEAAGRFNEQLRLNEKLEQDISARKRAEAALRESDERFRQVEEYAPIGLALVELEGRFTRVNPALCALTGYSREELLSTTVQALTHPDDLDADLAHIKQMRAGAISNYELEKRFFHKGGHTVWTLVSATLVRDEAGEPFYFIAQIQDINARKSAEQTLETAQIEALAATEAKSRFVATMSHEIRTPMNGIIGMTELLGLSPLTEEQSLYVRVVRDSGQSLLRVLDDILDYSKIEAGKLELEHIDFDLQSQLRSVSSLLGPQFASKGVTLTAHVDADVPVALKGDPGRVRQILINLVGNALKFTPAAGTVRVLVSSQPSSGLAVPVRFTVVDTGVGIAPDVRHRLFVPFSQVDNSTTRQFGGTGLGLSICKQLVELMGGQIGVTSELDSGSSFWFTLPFGQGKIAPRTFDASAGQNGERRIAVRPRPERLLLAEDNEINTLLAVKQFKRLGFDVTVVVNGREAVNAVANESFDVVFMDCHMPIMDGLEATRAIRSLPSESKKHVPIVAMTANAQAEDQQACLAAGMDDYIAKPSTLSAIQTALARWLPSSTREVIAMSEPVL